MAPTLTPITFWIKLKWRMVQYLFKAFLIVARSRLISPSTQPNFIKPHLGRPELYASRIFKPTNLPSGQHKTLPLIIDVHGGGFIINTPAADDNLSRRLADTVKCVVVNIDYRKGPQYAFPASYEDIVELVLDTIDDKDLEGIIDTSKVILYGCSAGGNLVLAAAQDPRLRGKILGVMALYPAANIVPPLKELMSTRPDPKVPDVLEPAFDEMIALYVRDSGVGFDDPRISPAHFKERAHLPENVYLIGVEHDLLCYEAEAMAGKLAVGKEKVSTERGWRAGGVWWDKMEGQVHGFDVFGPMREKKEAKAKRLQAAEKLHEGMMQWLALVFNP